MTDLFVDFGSNAPGVTREIDAMVKAFDKAAASAKAATSQTRAMAAAVKQDAAEMRNAAAVADKNAAAFYARARSFGRLSEPSFTPYSRQNGNGAQARTNAMRALVDMNRDLRRTAETGAVEVAASWQKKLGHAIASGGGAIGSKLGGPLGGLLGRTGAMLGEGVAGIGAAGLVGVGAAVAGIAVAWVTAATAIQQYKDKALGAVQATQFAANAANEALKIHGEAGAGAAGSQGKNLALVAGLGGGVKDSADKYASSFGVNDAYGAMLNARTKFGGRADEALGIAARAAKATGTSLSENVSGLSPAELDNPDLAASRLLAIQRGQNDYSASDIGSAEDALSYSPEAQGAADIRGTQGRSDLFAQSQIPQGAVYARGQLADLKDPAARAQLDAFNAKQQALEQLKAVETSFDRFLFWLSRSLYTGGATGQYNKGPSAPVGASQ